jgi:molybdopterin synthase catalytic subunit
MSEPTDAVDPMAAADADRRVVMAQIAESAISVEECAAAVASAHAGAVVTFSGVVRDHDEGRGVTALGYSAHPSAPDVLARVAAAVAAAHPEVVLAVVHRTGELRIGDVALACAVASAHRSEAFAACSALVDRVKAEVPIWKEQTFDDGTVEWVAALG